MSREVPTGASRVQLPLKSGLRFSMKALIASIRSFDIRNDEFHCATYSSPSSTVRPSLAAKTFLTPETVSGELAAISSASS